MLWVTCPRGMNVERNIHELWYLLNFQTPIPPPCGSFIKAAQYA